MKCFQIDHVHGISSMLILCLTIFLKKCHEQWSLWLMLEKKVYNQNLDYFYVNTYEMFLFIAITKMCTYIYLVNSNMFQILIGIYTRIKQKTVADAKNN